MFVKKDEGFCEIQKQLHNCLLNLPHNLLCEHLKMLVQPLIIRKGFASHSEEREREREHAWLVSPSETCQNKLITVIKSSTAIVMMTVDMTMGPLNGFRFLSLSRSLFCDFLFFLFDNKW